MYRFLDVQVQEALLDVVWGLDEEALPGCAAGVGDMVSRQAVLHKASRFAKQLVCWWARLPMRGSRHELASSWVCMVWRRARQLYQRRSGLQAWRQVSLVMVRLTEGGHAFCCSLIDSPNSGNVYIWMACL